MRFEIIRRGKNSLKRFGFIEFTTTPSGGIMLRIFGIGDSRNILYGRNKVLFEELVKLVGKHYQLCNYKDSYRSPSRMAEVYRLSKREVKSFKWVEGLGKK